MTRYLIDTNVLSTTALTTAVRRPDLIGWMDRRSCGLFLSAVTVAEIADGIANARREGTKRKAADLAGLGKRHSRLGLASTARRPLHWRPGPGRL